MTVQEIKKLSASKIADAVVEGNEELEKGEDGQVSILANTEGFKIITRWIEARIFELMLPIQFSENTALEARAVQYEMRSAGIVELNALLARVERAKENHQIRSDQIAKQQASE